MRLFEGPELNNKKGIPEQVRMYFSGNWSLDKLFGFANGTFYCWQALCILFLIACTDSNFAETKDDNPTVESAMVWCDDPWVFMSLLTLNKLERHSKFLIYYIFINKSLQVLIFL